LEPFDEVIRLLVGGDINQMLQCPFYYISLHLGEKVFDGQELSLLPQAQGLLEVGVQEGYHHSHL
jgi:hypothetical protein